MACYQSRSRKHTTYSIIHVRTVRLVQVDSGSYSDDRSHDFSHWKIDTQNQFWIKPERRPWFTLDRSNHHISVRLHGTGRRFLAGVAISSNSHLMQWLHTLLLILSIRGAPDVLQCFYHSINVMDVSTAIVLAASKRNQGFDVYPTVISSQK